MDWDKYIYAGAIGLISLCVGLVLLAVWDGLKRRQDNRRMRFIERFVCGKIKKQVIEIMSECMDILPEKITDVKRTIDEGGM